MTGFVISESEWFGVLEVSEAPSPRAGGVLEVDFVFLEVLEVEKVTVLCRGGSENEIREAGRQKECEGVCAVKGTQGQVCGGDGRSWDTF